MSRICEKTALRHRHELLRLNKFPLPIKDLHEMPRPLARMLPSQERFWQLLLPLPGSFINQSFSKERT